MRLYTTDNDYLHVLQVPDGYSAVLNKDGCYQEILWDATLGFLISMDFKAEVYCNNILLSCDIYVETFSTCIVSSSTPSTTSSCCYDNHGLNDISTDYIICTDGSTPATSVSSKNGEPVVRYMTHEYTPRFYNVEDFYHHPRTGKKVYKILGPVDPETNENYIDNTNIQDYLTKDRFSWAVSNL